MSDREIRRLAREGARSARAVAEACGAGSCCGGCRMTVVAILDEVDAGHERRHSLGMSLGGASPEAI